MNAKEIPKDQRICKICSKQYHYCAITSHQKSCQKKNAEKAETNEDDDKEEMTNHRKGRENSNSKKTTVEKSGGHSRRNLRRTSRSTIVEQSDSEDR